MVTNGVSRAEPLVAAMPLLCGGTASALAVVFFDGIAAPTGLVGGTSFPLEGRGTWRDLPLT